MKSHKDLDVWKKSMDLVANVYKIVRRFPVEEQFGLSSQLKRSAISIPSNIAEGAGRSSDKEFKQFISIALGSAAEVETQLMLAERLELCDSTNELQSQLADIRKMLTGLSFYLSKKNPSKK